MLRLTKKQDVDTKIGENRNVIYSRYTTLLLENLIFGELEDESNRPGLLHL